jgi:hypothetical protein
MCNSLKCTYIGFAVFGPFEFRAQVIEEKQAGYLEAVAYPGVMSADLLPFPRPHCCLKERTGIRG